MNKVTRVFLDVDLRNSHEGLETLAQSQQLDLTKLRNGEHVLFLNTQRTKFKMYSANGVLSYYRNKGKLDLNAIAHVPMAFNAKGELDWQKAQLLALKRKLNILEE